MSEPLIFPAGPSSDDNKWRCLSPNCRNKNHWWLSIHGVVNCLNCCAPSIPGIVMAQGDLDNAPPVEPNRSTTPTKEWLQTLTWETDS